MTVRSRQRKGQVIMKRLISLLCIVSSIFLLFSSCAEVRGAEGSYYSFCDSLGNTVLLDEKPKKVAVLFSSFADIWQTAGGRVDISVSDAKDAGYAPSDAVIVADGSGHTGINTELLLASEPDLVIGTADYPSQVEACEYMRSLGISAALFKVESFEDYLSVLKIFTDILQTPENYALYGTNVERAISELKSTFSISSPCTSLFLRTTKSSHKAMNAKGHFAAAMIDDIGVLNIAGSEESIIGGDLLELAIKSDPCYIFVGFMGDEGSARAYADSLFSADGWSSLSAVREGRVIYLPKSLFQQKPNRLWACAYEYIINEIKESPHAH